MRVWIYACILSLCGLGVGVPARAADSSEQSIDIKVLTWVDHFTYGAFNTAVGIPLAITGVIVNKIKGENPEFYIDKTGRQLVIDSAALNSGAYSTGAIHHGSGGDAHEAGHSHQSGVLGPLYLPVVLIDYAIEGHTGSVVERWADRWADLSTSMVNTHPVNFLVGFYDQQGHIYARLGANASLVERSTRAEVGNRYSSNDSDVASSAVTMTNRYGTIGAGVNLNVSGVKPCPCNGTPLVLDASIFQRDFLAELNAVGTVIGVVLDGHNETGSVSVDLDRKRIDSLILYQQVGVGMRAGQPDTVALDLKARGIASLRGIWGIGDNAGHGTHVVPSVGAGAEARLHFLDLGSVYGRKDLEVGTSGYRKDTDALGFQTPLFKSSAYTYGWQGRDLTNLDGRPTDLKLGVEYRHETETLPSGAAAAPPTSEIHMTLLTFGGRF
jgi:hypothetical protein